MTPPFFSMTFRIISWLSIFIVISQIILAAVLVEFGGGLFSTPRYQPNKADLIVILGGGAGDREKKGVDLYFSGYSKRILMTGFHKMNNGVIPAYAMWRLNYVLGKGIPEDAILLDYSAKNTFEESIRIKELMLSNKWHKVIVVSDPPHMRRLSIILKKVFGDKSNMSFLLIPSEPIWWNAEYWWKNTVSAQFILVEVVKMIYFYIANQVD